jgi:hypothetical protein
VYIKKYIIIIACFLSVVLVGCSKGDGKMSDQEKAEQFVKEMEPVMEKQIHSEDYNNFVKKIEFTNVSITPLGGIKVDGYVNQESLTFHYNLDYENRKDTSGFNPDGELNEKMGILEHDLNEDDDTTQKKSSAPQSSPDLKSTLSQYKLNL